MALFRQPANVFRRCVAQGVKNLQISDPRNIKRWVAPTLQELYRRRLKVGPEVPQPRNTYLEWNYDAELFAFGKRLGEAFDEQLLRQSLTHRSYVVQQGDAMADVADNKQLISDGDKIISDYVSAEFKKKYPDVLVKVVRDYLTSVNTLASVASNIGLKDLVLCADFPVERSTLADTFKAVVAALKLSTGPARSKLFVKDFLVTQMNNKDVYDLWDVREPLKRLRELLQNDNVEPRLCNQSASNTILATYQVGLYLNKRLLGIGFGESIEIAKDVAAIDAIQRIYSSSKKVQELQV